MSTRRKTQRLALLVDKNDSIYPGLKRVKLQGKYLVNLPPEVFELIELELLDLSPERQSCLDYRLREVPASISKLINLRVLMLDTNDLVSVPREICLLKNLERIALSNNQLSELPTEFGRLSNLQSLHLANNDFQEFPTQICDLPKLEFLDMSDNKLTKIPGKISKLRYLETLNLYSNFLERLPNSICELKRLRMLWIGNNNIRCLPMNFGKLMLLDWSWHYTSTTLDGNPLAHPPLEICKMGPDEIDSYMKRMARVIDQEEALREDSIDIRPPLKFSSDSGSVISESEDERLRKKAQGIQLEVDPDTIRNLRRGSTPMPFTMPDY